VVAIAATAFAGVNGTTTVATPGLVGRDAARAKALASASGMTVSVQQRPSPDPVGVVIDQSPDPGAWTSEHEVKLVVSSGPAPVAVPPIKGETWANAQKQLDEIGFGYAPPLQVYGAVPVNQVISVTPAVGTQIAPDATVKVVISKGRAPVAVADVTGQTFKQAKAALEGQHFKVVRGTDAFSNDVPAGKVASTAPNKDVAAPYGSTVQIVMSHGPIMATLPNVINQPFSLASDRLTQAGFQFSVHGTVHGDEVVVDQTPEGNQRVPLETTTVELTFGPPSSVGHR
jgi:eukaryotic-like serine/threonine-protein kinase